MGRKGKERHGERSGIARKGFVSSRVPVVGGFARSVASRTRAERINDASRQLALHPPHLADPIAHSSRRRGLTDARTACAVVWVDCFSKARHLRTMFPKSLPKTSIVRQSTLSGATGPPRPRARRGANSFPLSSRSRGVSGAPWVCSTPFRMPPGMAKMVNRPGRLARPHLEPGVGPAQERRSGRRRDVLHRRCRAHTL
jgi:hypothetical protein